MKRLLASLLYLLIPTSIALADGVGPLRKMTDAEAAAFSKARATIQNALPKSPQGYTSKFEYSSDCDEGTVPEALNPVEMFHMRFIARYTYDSSIGANQQMSAFMDRAKGTPEQQARMAELNAKDAELTEARDKTRDRAEKDRIRAELKAVRAESDKLTEEIAQQYQAWVASGGVNTAIQDVQGSLPAGEVSMTVWVNQDVSLPDAATPFAMDGASLAVEQSQGCQGADTYCITLFIGSYEKVKKVGGYTRYQLRPADLGVSTKVRGLAISIGGPKEKPGSVRDFARKIDLAALKTLLP